MLASLRFNFNGSEDKDYRFGFNGQHKENEVAGIGNHNSALFWEYDTRLGRRWNLDPKPNISISGYATFANNPIIFSDVFGDSINVSKVYEKNKDGSLKNRDKVLAFETFASTKEGREEILKYAEKGFSLKGELLCDLILGLCPHKPN